MGSLTIKYIFKSVAVLLIVLITLIIAPAFSLAKRPLAPPTNLAAIPGDGYLSVSWTAAPGVNRHRVRWQVVGETEWNKKMVYDNNFRIKNLTNGVRYKVQVKSKMRFGSSKYVKIKATPADPNSPIGGTDSDNDGLIEIVTWQQLDDIRNNLTATGTIVGCPDDGCHGFELVNDLNFNDSEWSDDGDGSWTPIGSWNDPFATTFNGNGNTISNLTIDDDLIEYEVGLFGKTDNATITNLTLEDADITGLENVGTLIGLAWNTTVTNSSAIGDVSGEVSVGGLIGVASRGTTVTNSSAHSYVFGEMLTGGLIGDASDDTAITNSYATGTVSGDEYVGGLIGGTSDGVTITGSYATSGVLANYFVGGLIGSALDTAIAKSYATGFVSGDEDVGGLIGYADDETTVINSYATGNASGDDNIGGLIGWGRDTTITNSYATGIASSSGTTGRLAGSLEDSTASSTYAEGDIASDDLVGSLDDTTLTNSAIKTATELQEGTPTATTVANPIFVDWDEDIWDFGTDAEYPKLIVGNT